MKHLFLLTTGLMMLLFCADAQIITILDRENYQPLEFVTLYCDTPDASAVTNQNGKAEITHFKKAKTIEIRRVGFETEVVSYKEIARKDYQLYMTSSEISLDHVIISATRWNQAQKEVPAKITAINTKQVALQNPQTAADLLATSGEVYIQKSQLGGGSPMIRGLLPTDCLLPLTVLE